ncbi:UNVERIFIED_CONTAM: ATP-dependent helicase/nuclease subunit A [Williamsia faeni]
MVPDVTTSDAFLVDADERSRIENDTASTLFVEAGAGSGKTHSLVQRICHLVLVDCIELDNIAAITFTEKAAAELRERVRDELAAHDTAEAEAALTQVDTAALGTLHAFAARIVSEHPLEAGVPPRISVVDAMGSQLSFERRWRRMRTTLFSDEATAPEGLAEAMQVVIGTGASLNQVRTLADALDRSWDRLRLNDSSPVLSIPDIDAILQAADLAVDVMDECLDPTDNMVAGLARVRAWRDDIAAGRDTTVWMSVVGEYPKLGNTGRGPNWAGGAARLREIRTAIKEAGELAVATRHRYVASALAVVVHHLSVVVVDEARERQREGRLEFHDLLVHARDVVSNPEVQTAVHRRYQRIMLDEFQDTDPLQLDIARRIVAGHGATGRLFTVGDPKQSIYRFRRADIASYMAARDDTATADVVRLTTNFRSTKPVLDWVNSVFNTLVIPEEHIQAEYAALDPAPGRPDWTDSSWGPHPFTFADDSDPTDDEQGLSPAEVLRAREAKDVARIIGTAIAEGWQKETGGFGEYEHTPVDLSDICILIPSRSVLPFLEKSLDAAGIEFRSEASSLVYSTQEVHDLLVTARALSNTADGAALVAALRTPLFGCGDDDLLQWKGQGGRWDLFAGAPAEQKNSQVDTALRYLKDVWWGLGRLTPGALLSKLATDRRVFEVSMDSPRHRDVWRRLRFVIDQAHAWYGEDGGDLRDYLDWAATQQEESARVAEAVLPEIGVNAVRIMTIHAAKGLQFPMVIVAGMSGGIRKTSEPVLWDADGELQIYLAKSATSLGYRAVAATEKAHVDAERVRLLYVACTRAESLLAVSGYRTSREDCWGAIVARGVAGVPNEKPHLIDPVRDDDDFAGAVTELESWAQWETETERIAAISSLPSSLPVTEIVHEKRLEGTTLLQAYRAAELLTATGMGEKVPAAVGSTESGPALGTALHALLESGGLGVALDDAFDERARAAARIAGLVDADRFVLLARSALSSEPVRRAAMRDHWQEMPLGGLAPGSDIVVEGIADLVYREDDGSLAIVDYKTDVGVSAVTLEQYWAQLAIYADLLRTATGEVVSSLVLIFCRPDAAVVLQRPLI